MCTFLVSVQYGYVYISSFGATRLCVHFEFRYNTVVFTFLVSVQHGCVYISSFGTIRLCLHFEFQYNTSMLFKTYTTLEIYTFIVSSMNLLINTIVCWTIYVLFYHSIYNYTVSLIFEIRHVCVEADFCTRRCIMIFTNLTQIT